MTFLTLPLQQHLRKQLQEEDLGMDTFRKCLAAVCSSQRASDQAEDTTKSLDKHLAQAFQSWRLQFCEKFVARMPREMRDMTYGFILEPEYIVQIRPLRMTRGGDAYRISFGNIDGMVEMKPKWQTAMNALFQHQAVGHTFCSELVQTFYMRSTFNVTNTGLLDLVLNNDFFGYNGLHRDYPPGLRIHIWSYLQSYRDRPTLQEKQLHIFLGKCIQKRLAVELVLELSDIKLCKRFLRNITVLMYKLKSGEAQVRIVLRYVYKTSESPYGPFEYAENDMTWLFEKPKEECLASILAARAHEDLGRPFHRVGPWDGVVRRIDAGQSGN